MPTQFWSPKSLCRWLRNKAPPYAPKHISVYRCYPAQAQAYFAWCTESSNWGLIWYKPQTFERRKFKRLYTLPTTPTSLAL